MASASPAQRAALKNRRGLVTRLTTKVGPLPVWGWAAVILGAYLLYSRMRPPAATKTDEVASASTPDGTTGAAQVPASGQGSSADNLSQTLLESLGANTSAIDALTAQVLSMPTPYSNFGDAPAAGTPAADLGQGTGPASQPQTQAPTTTQPVQAGASPGRGGTQAQAGVLKWGGLAFTTKTQFDSWARAHGTTTARELNKHPTAKAIYSTLR